MKLRHWGAALGFFSFSVLASAVFAGDDATSAPLSRIGVPNHAMSYVFEYAPADMALGAHPWGPNVNIAEAWLYARVFTDSGKQYVLMRTVRDLKSNGVTLQVDGKPDSRVPREAV